MATRDILRSGRRALERVMQTGVRVQWDPEGSADDTNFDYNTGQVVKPLNDAEIVYDEWTLGDGGRSLKHESGLGGRALVSPASEVTMARMQAQGGASFSTMPTEISIPLDAPTVGVGAVVEVVNSAFPFSDPELIDNQYVIRAVLDGTLLPARVFIAEQRTRAPD